MEEIQRILKTGTEQELRTLFAFDSTTTDDAVLLKFNLWARKYFVNYFTSEDASFHLEIDSNNLKAYRGKIRSFVNIAFRGAAKTARTKLFLGFCILNDKDHSRRFFKVLSADGDNSKQIVTDIYNMLVKPSITHLYPEVLQKTTAKREETMSSFTTATGVKMLADTVGTNQRGAIQEDARPDFIWFEDFENRETLRSARKTMSIWDNMEEARTGLALNGSSIYTCNYISEMGNVHTLVTRQSDSKVDLIVPIIAPDGTLAWNRYTLADIEQMRKDDDDFEGERLCKPSASRDVLFDRETLEIMSPMTPMRETAGFKIFKPFDPSHRYASGHDVAGGIGLDSSTSVFIDFSVIPAQVVATFHNNTIKPDVFGDEIARQGDFYGMPTAGIEKNNHGHATIARARQLDVNLYQTQAKDTKIGFSTPTEYGWNTNALTKPKMLFDFAKAVQNGWIALNDPDLIAECKSYTRNDLLDDEKDPRLTTRHFDLLIAACIAWQMKDFASERTSIYEEPEEEKPLYSDIGI